MLRFLSIGSLLLCLSTVAEARVRLLLFAPGTSALEAMTQIGFNENAFFKAQPRCEKDAFYPCRRRPMDGQYIGHGIPDGIGGCLLPTMYVFAGRREFSVSITVNAECGLRFHNFGPTLSFDDPHDYQPQALSFPDPDTEGPLWQWHPLVQQGQKIQQRRWVKARTKKLTNGESVTRILVGMDTEERLYPKQITPTLLILQYLQWARYNAAYVWRPDSAGQFLPGNPPAGGPYLFGATRVQTFKNLQNQSHTLITQVRRGPRNAQQGSCAISGTLPIDSAGFCEHRWSILDGPRPL